MMMTTTVTRIVLLLDLYTSVSRDAWLACVPEARDAHVITLTDCGAERRPGPEPSHGPVPWRALGQAVERMAARALELAAKAVGPVEFYVGGRVYLCLFTHLGYRISPFQGRHVLLGSQHGDHGPIEAFALDRPPPPQGVLTVKTDLSTESRSRGVVAACVTTLGIKPRGQAESAVENQGLSLAGFAEVASPQRATLTPENLPRVAQELKAFFSGLPTAFPKADALALFVAGPTMLAYLVGQAINPTVRAQGLQLTNHHEGVYSFAYRLPLAPPGADGPHPFTMSPVRVLFLAANPEPSAHGTELSPLALEREARDVKAALRQGANGAHFELKTEWAVQTRSLRGLLEEHRPHIVHLSCHGELSAGRLVLLDDHDRLTLVPPRALRELFELLRDDPRTAPPDDVRLVVLNACYSAEQAEALAEVVGCAIGMPQPIYDETAIEFARALYQQLASGKTIRQAFKSSQNQLALLDHAGAYEPQLFEASPGSKPGA